MARIELGVVDAFGDNVNSLDSVSWRCATPNGAITLFESLEDTVNKQFIIATLRNPDNSLYDPNLGVRAYARLHKGVLVFPWVEQVCALGGGTQ